MEPTKNLKNTNTNDLLKAVEQIKDIIQTQQTITDINNRINEWEIRLSEMREKYYDLDANKIKSEIDIEIERHKNKILSNFIIQCVIVVILGVGAIIAPIITINIKTLSKEDIKDIIQYTYQQQVIKHK